MTLLRQGVDVAVIALWLGHADIRSTDAYMHADMTIKEKALTRTTPPSTTPGCYKPPDQLLAFLESLWQSRGHLREHRADQQAEAPTPGPSG
jgi:integrase/recombinase XerC